MYVWISSAAARIFSPLHEKMKTDVIYVILTSHIEHFKSWTNPDHRPSQIAAQPRLYQLFVQINRVSMHVYEHQLESETRHH